MHPDVARAFDLGGRVAVVTGAASGIGRDTAIVLALAGARVILADRDEVGMAATARRIEADGGTAMPCPTDVGDRDAVERCARLAATAFGRLDVWVNAAGILARAPILEATAADLDRVIAVNLKGVYWGCAAAARAMTGGGGSIVNITSGGGESPVEGLSVYSMTKAAANMLTRTAARELGAAGIRVNAVAPGWIDTPINDDHFRADDGGVDAARRAAVFARCAAASPLGLTGTPRDVALAVLYLASDASAFVTGQILRPNGGVAMP